MRESFIFYRSFYEAIVDLPRDVQGEIYTAIMEYGLNGKETEQLKPIARSIFTLIKPQIDKNIIRYENGKKGGRPKTEPKPKRNQSETKHKPNVNDNVNEKDNPPFIPPSLDEVEEYFKSKGYTDTAAQNFHEYYELNDWHDKEGKQVKNWKLKAVNVWFRGEYKIPKSQGRFNIPR